MASHQKFGKWRTSTSEFFVKALTNSSSAAAAGSRENSHKISVTLYKSKGEKSDCSSYRGISLLAIAGKILARVLVNRLVSTIAEEHLPENQCGLRTNRGTSGMVFALRLIQEKCLEQNKGVFISFVDLTKAFDIVSRKGL